MKNKSTQITKSKPQKNAIIAERFKYLINKHGRLTARFVVDDARNPQSPIHDQFDWNDASAADKQRLAHARKLIVEVNVVITRTHFTYATVGYVRNPRIPPSEQGMYPRKNSASRPTKNLHAKQLIWKLNRYLRGWSACVIWQMQLVSASGLMQ